MLDKFHFENESLTKSVLKTLIKCVEFVKNQELKTIQEEKHVVVYQTAKKEDEFEV